MLRMSCHIMSCIPYVYVNQSAAARAFFCLLACLSILVIIEDFESLFVRSLWLGLTFRSHRAVSQARLSLEVRFGGWDFCVSSLVPKWLA